MQYRYQYQVGHLCFYLRIRDHMRLCPAFYLMVHLSVRGSATYISKNEKKKHILVIEHPGLGYLFIHKSTTLVIVFRGGGNAP